MKGVTAYQFELLTKLQGMESTSGRFADFDQLLEQLSWAPSKESAQFTIRAIVRKGFIEKMPTETRRGRNRVLYRMTEAGRTVLDPRGRSPSAVELSVPGSADLDILDLLDLHL